MPGGSKRQRPLNPGPVDGIHQERKQRDFSRQNLVSRRGDRLTPANRTAAGSRKAISFFKNEPASSTLSGIHAQFFGVGGFGNMLEMVEDFSLPDPKELRNLPQIQGIPV